MNKRCNALLGLSAIGLFAISPLSLAQESAAPPMHMHKSEMAHRPDKDVAAEYKTEATKLREMAQSHRKLSQIYAVQAGPKGGADFSGVAKHCEKLAKLYEDAAKEADAVSTELGK
jgi:hypothetical protein